MKFLIKIKHHKLDEKFSRQRFLDPDPVCPKRLDPDQVCHERLDPATPLPLPLCSPMVVIFSNLNDTLRANLRVTLISQ